MAGALRAGVESTKPNGLLPDAAVSSAIVKEAADSQDVQVAVQHVEAEVSNYSVGTKAASEGGSSCVAG